MSKPKGGHSSIRLPLFILLGFCVVVAGVVIWLTVAGPDDPGMRDAPMDASAPKQDMAEKPAAPGTEAVKTPAPDTPAEKPAPAGPAKPDTAANGGQDRSDSKADGAPEDVAEKMQAAPHTTAPAMNPGKAEGASNPPGKPDDKTPAPLETKSEAPKPAKTTAPPPKAARPLKRTTRDRPVMPKPLPRTRPDAPLPAAPDPGLVQSTALGPLPRVGDDGRHPYQVYAKPFDRADKRPRIGIVVTGLGLSDAATESAIQGLPGGVTLAFAPYSPKLNEWIRLARAAGHEVLVNVPMEPVNYPAYDPGPQTLLTSMNAEGNLDRLLWSLSRGTGYVGVVDFYGSRFTTSRKHMRPVLAELKKRGLLYLDSGSSTRSISPAVSRQLGLWAAISTLTLDERASRKNIDRKFGELEKRAREDKSAIGIASPYPVSLERIAAWVRQLRARGIAIAPISAIATDGSKAKKP